MEPLCLTLFLQQLPVLCADKLVSQNPRCIRPARRHVARLVSEDFPSHLLASCIGARSCDGVSYKEVPRHSFGGAPPYERRLTGLVSEGGEMTFYSSREMKIFRRRRPPLRTSAWEERLDEEMKPLSAMQTYPYCEGLSEKTVESIPPSQGPDAFPPLEKCNSLKLGEEARNSLTSRDSLSLLAEENLSMSLKGEGGGTLQRTDGFVFALSGAFFFLEKALILASALRLRRSSMLALAIVNGSLCVGALREAGLENAALSKIPEKNPHFSEDDAASGHWTSFPSITSVCRRFEENAARSSLEEMNEEAAMKRSASLAALDQEVYSPFGCRETNEGGAVCFLFLPLTSDNVAVLVFLLLLCVVGLLQLARFALGWSRGCQCPLCRGKITLEQKLGRGGYGTVWKARLKGGCLGKPCTRDVVLKKAPVEDITAADSFQQEARRLALLSHKYIVKYEGDFIHQEPGFARIASSTYLMLLMEFCPRGDLKRIVDVHYRRLTERRIRRWLFQLLQAVAHLHERNIIHRDLKTQNVFVADDGSLRLGDFGLCRAASAPSLTNSGLSVHCDSEGGTLFDLSSAPSSGAVAYADTFASTRSSWSFLPLRENVVWRVVSAFSSIAGSAISFCVVGPLKFLLGLVYSRVLQPLGGALFERRSNERNSDDGSSSRSGVGLFSSKDSSFSLGGLSLAGTDCYMAPEVIARLSYGKPADMWGLGCVLFELCTGVFLWELESPLATLLTDEVSPVRLENLLDAHLPSRGIGSPTRALLHMLLQPDPAMRPTASQLLRLKYFKKDFKCRNEEFGDRENAKTSTPSHPGYPRRDANTSSRSPCAEMEKKFDFAFLEPCSWGAVYYRKLGVHLGRETELQLQRHSGGSPTPSLPVETSDVSPANAVELEKDEVVLQKQLLALHQEKLRQAQEAQRASVEMRPSPSLPQVSEGTFKESGLLTRPRPKRTARFGNAGFHLGEEEKDTLLRRQSVAFPFPTNTSPSRLNYMRGRNIQTSGERVCSASNREETIESTSTGAASQARAAALAAPSVHRKRHRQRQIWVS